MRRGPAESHCSAPEDEPLLRVRGLVKEFVGLRSPGDRRPRRVRVVNGVDLDVDRCLTHGLVGETGSGKSTVARTIIRLDTPTEGSAHLNGRDIFRMRRRELRQARREVQMVFQNPFASLNPRMTVQSILAEPLHVHGVGLRHEIDDQVAELLIQVGLSPDDGSRYPHQFSGGQRQRVGIARALALEPKLIIADEPVSALDVSIRAQVLALLDDIQRRKGIGFLLIAHDLAVVRHMAHRVSVMYLGQIVESGSPAHVFGRPAHPYTQALLSAVPDPRRARPRRRFRLRGEPPSILAPPSGCRFRTRCPRATIDCTTIEPALTDRGNGHSVACFFPD